jgi:hypothetical protein
MAGPDFPTPWTSNYVDFQLRGLPTTWTSNYVASNYVASAFRRKLIQAEVENVFRLKPEATRFQEPAEAGSSAARSVFRLKPEATRFREPAEAGSYKVSRAG